MADNMILLDMVRVSFPHLYERPTINGQEGKCGATLLLDPEEDGEAIDAIKREIVALSKEKFKGKTPPSDKLCLRDGEDKGRDEYEGYVVLSSNSRETPLVIDASGEGVVKSSRDCSIYAGCYVNAKVRLWAQDNQFGRRINAELIAIQFAADGEPLDGTRVSVDEAMSGFGSTSGADDDFLGDAA